MKVRLEFWPDYGADRPIFSADGKTVELHALPLSEDLRRRLLSWNEAYVETKLPIEGPGEQAYLGEGRRLLSDVRQSLGDRYEVVVQEDWWGEPGLPFDRTP